MVQCASDGLDTRPRPLRELLRAWPRGHRAALELDLCHSLTSKCWSAPASEGVFRIKRFDRLQQPRNWIGDPYATKTFDRQENRQGEESPCEEGSRSGARGHDDACAIPRINGNADRGPEKHDRGPGRGHARRSLRAPAAQALDARYRSGAAAEAASLPCVRAVRAPVPRRDDRLVFCLLGVWGGGGGGGGLDQSTNGFSKKKLSGRNAGAMYSISFADTPQAWKWSRQARRVVTIFSISALAASALSPKRPHCESRL